MNLQLKLANIQLKNFKNLRISENGLLLRNLNVFIGPNGSGKSNFVGVLKFLRDALASEAKDFQGITEFEQSIIAIGHGRILDALLKPPGVVSFAFTFPPVASLPEGLRYEFEILVESYSRLAIRSEKLSNILSDNGSDTPFVYYEKKETSGVGRITLFGKEEGVNNILPRYADSIPANRLSLNVIPKMLEERKFPEELIPVSKVRRQMIETFSNWRFYNANDMDLKEIRDAEPKIGPTDDFISPSGNNLPLIFHNLNQNNLDFEDQINSAIKAILPKTRKIRAVHSGRLRLTIEWYMNETDEPFYLNDMSDGTVRMLLWAIILLSPELPSLLVIDEPEMGLHPAWMKTLSEWIKTAAEKTQVILSTHSPDLLDHFTDQYENVFSFNYDGKNYFSPSKLEEEALRPKIEEGWELGDLYRVGDPAVEGWPW